MYIDSIIPFNFNKEEALKKLMEENNKRSYVNRKIFRHVTKQDIKGLYINCVVFDFETKKMRTAFGL